MPEHKIHGVPLSEDAFRAQAVYSDETKQFRSPAEPLSTDEVEITIRVGKAILTILRMKEDLRSFVILQHLTGQKGQSCIRFIRTASAMAMYLMMLKPMSMFIWNIW